ncbi:hypothetical protein AK812_SmicGene44898, partial [Symbiodinium microadriaticum]
MLLQVVLPVPTAICGTRNEVAAATDWRDEKPRQSFPGCFWLRKTCLAL